MLVDYVFHLFICSLIFLLQFLTLLMHRLLNWLLVNLSSLKRSAKKLTLFHHFITMKFLTTIRESLLLMRFILKFLSFWFCSLTFIVRIIVLKVILFKKFILSFVKNLSIGLILLH